MNGRINGTSKSAYLKVAKDPEARAELEFDIMEHVVDTVKDLKSSFGEQPKICQKKFVQYRHVKIAGLIILAFLLGAGWLTWPLALRLISLA